jgi:hypothetical protein
MLHPLNSKKVRIHCLSFRLFRNILSDLPISLIQINQTIQDHVKMLSELKVRNRFKVYIFLNDYF